MIGLAEVELFNRKETDLKRRKFIFLPVSHFAEGGRRRLTSCCGRGWRRFLRCSKCPKGGSVLLNELLQKSEFVRAAGHDVALVVRQ